MSSFDITEEHFYYGTDMLQLSYQSPPLILSEYLLYCCYNLYSLSACSDDKDKKKLLVQIRKSKQ